MLSIEFFLTEDLRLLVNELAPRVHNSGHYTLNAAERSQFEVHVRAAMGERLEQRYFATRPAFAMLNLLGPDGFEGELPPLNFAPAGQVPVYDYAKGVSRPRRKLGHWNWVSETSVPRERMEFALDEMRAEWNRWLGEKTNGKESP